MARIFLKQPSYDGRNGAGCLSGITSIFDFRIGLYSQKLLTERKSGVGRNLASGSSRKKLDLPSNLAINLEDIDDGDARRCERTRSGMTSIKTLMEEEMSKIHNTEMENDHLDRRSHSQLGIHVKEKKKKINKTDITTDQQVCSCPLPESIIDGKEIHLNETNLQFSEKYLTILMALNQVAKKLVDSTELINTDEVQSREFVDALEILSSNKELLAKLIQEPNLPLSQHIQDIQNSLVECKFPVEETTNLRKNEVPKGSDDSQDISKIVVLKPSPAGIRNVSVAHNMSSLDFSSHYLKHEEEGKRTKSYFSFKGLKRRLKHVMGENKKRRDPIPLDGVLDGVPHGLKGSEVKKNITDRVAVRDAKDSAQTVSKSVIYIPEYKILSSRLSSENQKELLLPTQQNIASTSLQLNEERGVGPLLPLQDNKLNQEEAADIKIIETSDIKSLEDNDHLNVCRESVGDEPGVTHEQCKGKISSSIVKKIPCDECQLTIPYVSSSPSFLEKPEGPSPVSVLEPFCLEDIPSPGIRETDQVDLHEQPQQPECQEYYASAASTPSVTCLDEEAIYDFITTLLLESGMNSYEILEELDMSEQLLGPSPSGAMLCILPADQKLLLDCVREVLAEIQKRLFECSHWVSLIKPRSRVMQRGFDLIEEVCKCVLQGLQLSELTLDHSAAEDVNSASWVDHQVEIEDVVIEIAGEILEEIIEEITMSQF